MVLRIGIVGLGDIAQKVYLPLLCQPGDWTIAGAYSPNHGKGRDICAGYRIPFCASLDALAGLCDAVFVHSSTGSHFDVVSALLGRGMHVYVDKPLADTLSRAEQLVELAERRKRALMVGFNRRFAPLYLRLKQQLQHPASIRMDKHRKDSVGPQDMRFTLLDDYLHVVDTALWLADGAPTLQSGVLRATLDGRMLYAEHHFRQGDCCITTSMHRRAGSQRETLAAVDDGALYHIEDMRLWRHENQGVVSELPVPAWQTVLTQRGFTGAVRHFLEAVSNQTAPLVSGQQALQAQSWIEKLLANVDTPPAAGGRLA
ncbi:Gfo/Idh/MocA family protein [Martelella alba]|uniref:Gfo/Idh/MocA family oxidoreductase n=1 Tax=Martelella alba TaxID=2590451 RepID=A0ABY2SQK8_9HYPH|nr:Gfo/Idh/MocA family oxidoreductase [Martelella alba]TKI08256.1 Gfo/Idh/MocA family oxidoreductase [Martelella alba]